MKIIKLLLDKHRLSIIRGYGSLPTVINLAITSLTRQREIKLETWLEYGKAKSSGYSGGNIRVKDDFLRASKQNLSVIDTYGKTITVFTPKSNTEYVNIALYKAMFEGLNIKLVLGGE